MLTLGELNKSLDDIARADNSKKQVPIMTSILQKSTAEDMRWITRIILKDLKIGVKHERILHVYHPSALELYNLTSNLREVCKEFENKEVEVGTNTFRVSSLTLL